MDQVRPHMREQRFADCASLDWPTGPHPTLSGSGPAPTADRSKTPVAGLAREGLTPQGPLQKPAFLTRVSDGRRLGSAEWSLAGLARGWPIGHEPMRAAGWQRWMGRPR